MICYARAIRQLRIGHDNLRKEANENSKAEKTMSKEIAKLKRNEAKNMRAALKTKPGGEFDIQDMMGAFDRFATGGGGGGGGGGSRRESRSRRRQIQTHSKTGPFPKNPSS